MNKKLIVIGAGGHAKVLVDALVAQSRTPIGLTDTDHAKTGTSVLGINVIGDDTKLSEYPPDSVMLVNGIGSVGPTDARRKVFETLKARGYTFASVRHAAAVISASADFAEGVQAMAGCVIQADCVIGENTIINTKASVDHDCRLGAHVHVAPGATLSGSVEVGDNVHIGAGATILQNICIGKNCVIGAGALVIRDIPANARVAGVPAKEIGK